MTSPQTKGCFIKDIKDNQAVKGLFLVKDANLAETRAGKPFLTVSLMDKTGELTGRVWDNAEALQVPCKAGNIISITGASQSYKGALQLKIQSAQAIEPENIDWSLFVQASPYEIKDMVEEINKFLGSVSDPHLHQLMMAFLEDTVFMDLFQKAPAAKNMHHAYIGGLLEHTLGVIRLADNMAKIYQSLDRSLLICGAFLHDMGKVKEFSFETPPFDYSDKGRLVGHMVIAIELLQEKISSLADFPIELADRLKHLILSHHGKYEFGSPALPMTREAFVLNFIDDMDAKMNYLDRLSEQAEGEGYEWTPYQRMMERFLFVTGNRELPVDENIKEPTNDVVLENDDQLEKTGKQNLLWE